jgi:hypothetical protein
MTDAAETAPAKSVLVGVGVGTYEHLEPLPRAVSDVEALAHRFQNAGFSPPLRFWTSRRNWRCGHSPLHSRATCSPDRARRWWLSGQGTRPRISTEKAADLIRGIPDGEPPTSQLLDKVADAITHRPEHAAALATLIGVLSAAAETRSLPGEAGPA